MAGDSNYPYTSLLLHFDGADGSTAITDSSVNEKIITAKGDAKLSNVQYHSGGTSCKFDGTGDYLSIPHHIDFDFLAEDLTIELWCYFTNVTAASSLIAKASSSSYSPFLVYCTGGTLYFYASATGASWGIGALVIGSVAINTPYQVAVTKIGNTWRTFLNGVLQSTLTQAITLNSNTENVTVGGRKNGASSYESSYVYLDEVRVLKGIGAYSDSYTPLTTPFISGLGQLTGNVTEGSYSYISKWLVKAWKSFSSTISREQVVTGATYTVDLPTLDPYCLAAAPYIDGKWEANKVVTAGQFYVTSNPETSAHLWEVTTGGTFGATEASWNLSGTTTQGTAILTYVGVLPNPSILGPKIPS